jgi:large subunit ribosomal protein L18
VAQHTLAAASTLEPALNQVVSSSSPCTASEEVGKIVAQRAQEKGITKVVFDRGGNLYHGRVKALAEAARAAGLDF